MTSRRRFVVSIVITAITFAVMLVTIGVRLHHWSQKGWVGLNYFPEMPKRASKRAPNSILESGRVVVAFPGGPATRAGITGTDAISSVNGIPIADMKRITEIDRMTHTGDTITYHVKRDRTERDVRVRLESPVTNPRMVLLMLFCPACWR